MKVIKQDQQRVHDTCTVCSECQIHQVFVLLHAVWLLYLQFRVFTSERLDSTRTEFLFGTLRARAHQGNWQPQRNRNFRELISALLVKHTLLNGAAQIDETAFPFPQFALLHSVTCVQLRLIKILGNCGCVAVASFLVCTRPESKVSFDLCVRRGNH
jgi:hypothetical protein